MHFHMTHFMRNKGGRINEGPPCSRSRLVLTHGPKVQPYPVSSVDETHTVKWVQDNVSVSTDVYAFTGDRKISNQQNSCVQQMRLDN